MNFKNMIPALALSFLFVTAGCGSGSDNQNASGDTSVNPAATGNSDGAYLSRQQMNFERLS